MAFPRTYTIVDHDRRAEDRRLARRQRRVVKDHDRDRFGGDRAGPTLVLFNDPGHPTLLLSRTNGIWHRLLARLASSRLDCQLASGVAPESNGLLAARAERLVSPLMRWALAQNWEALLLQVHRPPVMRDPRVPLCRDRILAAEDDVRVMLDALTTPLPVPARGIAMVNRLLGDGTGPLYNRDSATDVRAVLRVATELLDPAAPLAQSA
jgi:hypothetical protein